MMWINTKLFVLLIILSLGGNSLSQCPESSFSFGETYCRDQDIILTNSSMEANSYIWDFCTGELRNKLTSVNGIGLPTTSPLGSAFAKENGNWFGFITDRSQRNLYRLKFGNSLSNIPQIENLGNPGNLLELVDKIELFKDNGFWYAFLTNDFNSNNIIRLLIGPNLGGSPTGTDLGNANGLLNRPRGLAILKDGSNFILITSNFVSSDIVMFNIGNSITNPISSATSIITNIPDSDGLLDLEIIKECENWYGLVNSWGSRNKLLLLDFGTNLFSSPIISEIAGFSGLIDNPSQVEARHDGENWKVFVSNSSEDSYRATFTNNVANPPTIESIDIGLSGISGLKIPIDTVGFGINFKTNELIRFDFNSPCSASSRTSTDFEPTSISYNETGTYNISLAATDANGNTDYQTQTIEIYVPNAEFSTGNGCSQSVNNFLPSLSSGSYSWDFNNDGTPDSFDENPSYQFPVAGTYTVRLDVDDGTCGNFTEQEITIYEEPPAPSFQVNGLLCGSSEITFTNQTNDVGYAGPLAYEWDFNGEATASTKDATFTFGSGGQKIITLTSSIPGCENISEQTITLIPGPTSLFSANSICAGELMTFTNQSAGADSYLWDFGDGFTSTQADVTHVYTEGGNFTVLLEATDTDGCSAIYEQEVAVSPVPVAGFDYDIPCSGSQGIPFFDLSAVDGADILSWEWTIDGEVATTEQNPIISFDESGSHIIGLSVLSSNGCDASYTQTVDVLASPDPAFSVDVACQNLVTRFMDNTPVETVVSRLWTIDGQTYTTQEVDYVFSESGTFNVSLTVTSDDFCSSTIASTVVVPSAPSMEFTISSLCSGDNILLDDTSIQGADPVVSRTWLLDGEPFFNGVQAQLTDLEPLSYEITLESTTQAGCMFSATQTANLLASPEADFESSVNYGVPPFEVNFSNSSAGATSYSWLINGVEVSTSPDFTNVFSTEGNHTVELVIGNDNGCSDTQKINILSALPAINLQIDQVTLTPSGVAQTISLQVSNNGNLPVEIFDVIIRAGTDFSISERINKFLDIGEQTTVQLTSSLQSINADNICISIVSAYDDVVPDDNEECVSFSPTIILENPYPNPVGDEATIRLILPESNDVNLSIVNTAGKQMISESYEELSTGLHVFRYDFSQFEKGIYLVTVKFQGKMVTKRILKF